MTHTRRTFLAAGGVAPLAFALARRTKIDVRVAGVFYLRNGKIVEWIDAVVPAVSGTQFPP